MKEEWRTVGGFEEYVVSNLGNCKRIVHVPGSYKTGINLKPKVMRDGYELVRFVRDGKQVSVSLHRVIAKAFILNPDNKKEVNHKNLVKNDNRVENLEWVTPKENMVHARKNKVWKLPGVRIGRKRKSKSNFEIVGFYSGMTSTKEGKKEYMRQYREFKRV